MLRFEIDLNERDSRGWTPARYSGPEPRIGAEAVAFETEDQLEVPARIVAVDHARRIAYLHIEWRSLGDDAAGPCNW